VTVRRSAFKLLVLGVSASGVVSCAAIQHPSLLAPQPGNQYVIVDCEVAPRTISVPGGGVMTLPSRPVRTSARDCYDRGGIGHFEDSPDALALWQPIACQKGTLQDPAGCQGDPEAQYLVGDLLEHGAGGPSKLHEAFLWYERAAQQGHRAAAAKIARWYEHGIGVEPDASQAAHWYAVASASDDTGTSLTVDDVLRQQERVRQFRRDDGAGGDESRGVQVASSGDATDPLLVERAAADAPPTRAPTGREGVACPAYRTYAELAALSRGALTMFARQLEACSGIGPHEAGTSPPQPEDRYYAIFIANESYVYWPRLETPSRDAAELRSVLQKKFGFETVAFVSDGHDRDSILKPLNDLQRQIAQENDQRHGEVRFNVLVFYSGYGRVRSSRERRSAEGYWIPTKAPADEFSTEWVLNGDVARYFSLMKAVFRVLVVADSCFAEVMEPNLMDRRSERDPSKGPSRKLLSPGTERPTQQQPGTEHSRFTQAIVTVLEQATDRLTGSELFDKIRGILGPELPGAPRATYLEIDEAGHEAGDFVFRAKRT